MATDNGTVLHSPGKTKEDNLRFLTFAVETLVGVYRHNGLLKASIMSATNQHRLGANEAPPAIISAFLGKQISEVLEKIENSTNEELISIKGTSELTLDIPQIPDLKIDNTDRNRTSPFAFTGNRFEFRAVGAQANCAEAMTVLNTAVAEALTNFKARVDQHIANGEDKITAIIRVLREDIKTCKPIHFEGNGYSDEWKAEAARRGLDCETSCPVIFDRYLDPESINMFESQNVMRELELKARNEIKWDTYTKKIQIEARVFGDMAMNQIIPVATRYQSMLIDNISKIATTFTKDEAERLNADNIKIVREISEHTRFIIENVNAMIEARKVANRIESEREKAIQYHDTVQPYLETIRYHVDKLELIVEDELWVLPKYRELLFIR